MTIIVLTEAQYCADGFQSGGGRVRGRALYGVPAFRNYPVANGGRGHPSYGYKAGGSEPHKPYEVHQGGKTEAGISDDPLILSSKQYAS